MNIGQYCIYNFYIETLLTNKYVHEYFYYRFLGFRTKMDSINSDLNIKQISNIVSWSYSIDKNDIMCDDYVKDSNDNYINILDYKNYLIYDKKQRTIFVYIEDDNRFMEKVISIRLVSLAISLLMQKNIFCLHGACVEVQKNGILMMGNSGSGKTSLLLKCIEKNARITNDDATFIKIKDGKFISLKNTQYFGLTQNGIGTDFPYMSDCVEFVDDNSKYRIDVGRVYEDIFADYITIHTIIWISSERAKIADIHKIGYPDIIGRILKNGTVHNKVLFQEYVQNVVDLVLHCDNYELVPCNGLEETFKCLSQAFDIE